MIRPAASGLLIAGLVLLGACDSEEDSGGGSETTSTTRGTDNEDVRFLNVTHDDGTQYRCVWRAKAEAGGLWCENLTSATTSTTEESPFD
jgi:major membrane immunogen (membrane-anchored lipoprotein)